ncbi:MAG: T9SS type A sorting domain-containing protein [Flavobacteriales bacterium]
MKRLLLFFAALCMGYISQAQLNQVVVEVFDPATINSLYVPPTPGSVTYRVYAELATSIDKVVEIGGELDCTAGPLACVVCNPSIINTTTTFYNDAGGDVFGGNINPIFFNFVPSAAGDSWMTIGRQDSSVPGSQQASPGDAQTAVNNSFGIAGTGGNYLVNDGSIFTTPDQPNTFGVGPNNRVLLGQFTTDGEFSFALNLSVQIGGVLGTPFTKYVHNDCAYTAGNEAFGITFVNNFPSLTFPAAVAVDGCTDVDACNYDDTATNDDGSCILPGDPCDDGDVTTLNDVILADCSCAGVAVPGCNDGTACNFDPSATVDDGSCIFPGNACDDGDATTVGDIILADCSCAGVQVPGCTNLAACNYDASATIDNGSCILPGDSCDDGDPTTVGDQVQIDCSCAGVAVPGCINPAACNFDAAATVDNGTCILPGDACDDGDALTENDVILGDCSCAGTPVAIDCEGTPNGSALPGTPCDDNDVTTENDVYQADCSCAGTLIVVPGCTDPTACNFNPAANQNDGSCATLDCNDECGGTAFLDGCECVGGSTGIPPGGPGCTDPAAENFNASATCGDGSCVYTTLNDIPAFASVLNVTFIGTCSSVAGDVNQATVVAPEATATSTAGLWYRFTAVTAGARVSVETADFDAVVELQDAAHNSIDIEDVNAGNGNEVLNIGSLTAGADYFVRVAPASPTSGAAQFDICVQWLPDTEVDRAADVTNITRSLCQNAKADWVSQGGANYTVVNYIFTFIGEGTEVTAETGAAFTVLPLSNVNPALTWEGQYDVAIDLELVMADGSGASENVVVENTTSVGLTIPAPPSTNLRPADNLVNAGPLFPNALIYATPWVCTTSQWEWEFTNAAGGLPIPFISANFDRRVRLSDVEGLMPGEVYNVRVRPLFANGYDAPFGAVDQIAIIGSIGLAPEIESPVVVDANDVERTFEVSGPEFALYPNPNNGEFVNINLSNVNSDVERIAVDIYDSFGKLVISRQIANAGSQFNVIMPLDGIAAGVYTVSIIMNDEVRTERMIVQR